MERDSRISDSYDSYILDSCYQEEGDQRQEANHLFIIVIIIIIIIIISIIIIIIIIIIITIIIIMIIMIISIVSISIIIMTSFVWGERPEAGSLSPRRGERKQNRYTVNLQTKNL